MNEPFEHEGSNTRRLDRVLYVSSAGNPSGTVRARLTLEKGLIG